MDSINNLSIKIILALISIGLYLVSCTDNTDKITNYLSTYGDFEHSDTCMVDLCHVYGIDFDSILIFDGWEHEEAIEAFVENRSDLIGTGFICNGSDYTSEIVFVNNGEIVKTLSNINFKNENTIFSEDYLIPKGGFWNQTYYGFNFKAYIFPKKLLAIREFKDSVLKYTLHRPGRFLDILEYTDIIRNVEFGENEIGYKKHIIYNNLKFSNRLDCSNIRKKNKFFESDTTLKVYNNHYCYYLPVEKSAFDDFEVDNYKEGIDDFEVDIVFHRIVSSKLDTLYCAYISKIVVFDNLSKL